jgi:hypothetical protein
MMQDRVQSRYDERAAKNAEAIATRQEQAADEAAIQKILDELAQGGDPASAASRISARTGRQVDPLSLESVRPSPRRRMEKAVGEGIDKATSPEMIDSDETIAGKARTEGLALPAFAYEGMEPTSYAGTPDPFEYTGGISREFGERAGAKRRSLMEKPSKQVTVTHPDLSETTQFVSEYGDPIQTKPDAATMGKGKGAGTVAELDTAGPALAAQAGREASARTRAQLAAELSQLGITGQQQTAALTLADDYAKQSAVFTGTKQAVSNLSALAKRIESARRAGKDSPAAHIGMIFNFMKMQDATSTVRETEQSMAEHAASLPDRARNIFMNVLNGGRLTPEQVTDFLQTATSVYTERAAAQQALERDYTERATTLRVPPKLVIGYVSALEGGPSPVDPLGIRK